MSRTKTVTQTESKPSALKTWAVRLSVETHEALTAKCRGANVGLQQLADQMIELFLADQLPLKKAVFLPAELADLLRSCDRDPKLYSDLLKLASGKKG